MNKNNKTKKSISIVRFVTTPLLSSFIGWIVGQFFSMPFLLMGRSDPIDSSIGYTISSSQKSIQDMAMIGPYFFAFIGFLIGIYLNYKKTKNKNS